MKSRKVLLGLIAGFFVCFAGTATAQKANFQSNKLVEIGPDNIGGRVTSMIVVNNRLNGDSVSIVYAGAASGGLYVRNDSSSDIWKYLPCYVDGKELTLPISSMVMVNDSTIMIATGESYYAKGSKLNKMAALGRGIFLFNCNDNNPATRFTRLNATNPGFNLDADFASVNAMAMMKSQGVTYVYVATPKGLFRWNVSQTSDWSKAPVKVYEGDVHSVVVSKQYNRAFFTSEGNLYKISDVVNSSSPVNITGSCTGFGANASCIDLALAPSDESYLYAMVSNADGLMTGLYLTRNTNNWILLSTSTVTPFSSVATAKTCGAIAVSPIDPAKVYIGGANLWVGKGYVENTPFQWTAASSNEVQLNGGDYMSMVYSNSQFVHSGIQEFVPYVVWDEATSTMVETLMIATDGGVYAGTAVSSSFVFSNYNRGMNNVQINSLAVCPDGSIISGANSNACPFIEARTEHDSGANNITWYDGSGSNTNHMANIIWKGNGGAVATSRFNQYLPISRRPIFVSSANASVGRCYADFSNYTNTQTWTSDIDFMTDYIAGGPAIGQIYLWETDHNTASNDSMTFTIDTLSYILRNGTRHNLSQNFQIKAGDSILVLDPAHAAYPFYHRFDHGFTVRNELRHTIPTPYLSRLLAVTIENDMPQNTKVSYCWFPTDFRKVFDNDNETRFWSHIYGVNRAVNPHYYVRLCAMSQDGDCAFIVVENDTLKQSFLVRVHGFNSINYNQSVPEIRSSADYRVRTRATTIDTIMVTSDSYYFDRRISSISVDPRPGHDGVILTFDGYNTTGANVVYIDRATAANYQIKDISLPTSIPTYSAMVEYTKGEVYVGTEDGVFKAASVNNPSWSEYGDFRGVPVTSMYQVTCDYPVVQYTGHDGVTEVLYVFPRTKWSKAMYFGTYGRGIFMDSTYVVDHTNEIVPPEIYLDIPSVSSVGDNSVRFYPNPAVNRSTMEITVGQAGKASMRIYDLSGKMIYSENLGNLTEGVHTRTIDCQALPHGMYLVNVVIGSQRATSKLIVR